MLKNNLLGRFTAKWWDDRKVDESDLQYISECAYLAPSKQEDIILTSMYLAMVIGPKISNDGYTTKIPIAWIKSEVKQARV